MLEYFFRVSLIIKVHLEKNYFFMHKGLAQ